MGKMGKWENELCGSGLWSFQARFTVYTSGTILLFIFNTDLFQNGFSPR